MIDMKRVIRLLPFVGAAAVVVFAADPKPVPVKVEGTIHSINVPYGNFDLPAGPNFEVYQSNCVSCHTSRYVTNQPNFPRKVWEAEVTKMVKSYGAPIDEEKQKLIVDYLMSVRGTPDSAPAPTPAK
jgi:sulfite dehydrogenase (cytochrome) subunit B